MANLKLGKALEEVADRKADRIAKGLAARAAADETVASFQLYRDEVLIPMLIEMSEDLQAKGYVVQIIKGEDLHPPLHDYFVEMRFRSNAADISGGGSSVVFLKRNGVEFIAIPDRPSSLTLAHVRGIVIDPNTASPEDLVINFIVSMAEKSL